MKSATAFAWSGWSGIGVAAWMALASGAAHAAQPWELRDGDRVAIVGGTFAEREPRYGQLEARLTAAFPERNLLFRNLGWSGDNVWGHSRSGFGPLDSGFEELRKAVAAVQPTVILVAYGGNEAYAGPAGQENFVKGLERLLDMLAASQARLVLLTPPPQENMGPPLPDSAAQNANLALYAAAIRQTAERRKLACVDLFGRVSALPPAGPRLTDNGLHYGARGYWQLGQILAAELGAAGKPWTVELSDAGRAISASGVKVSEVKAENGGMRFTLLDEQLPSPPPAVKLAHGKAPAAQPLAAARQLQIRGLPPGTYALRAGETVVATATAEAWAAGQSLNAGPEFLQAESLRQAILTKNELFFHRWRPQNVTYLFGFRKHEQGNNAVEIPQFDPLVAEQEAKIARLRKPVPHVYQLTRLP